MTLFVRINTMAGSEWIASVACGATANGNVIFGLTIGIETTSAHTGIHTAIILALQISTAVDVIQTFATIAGCQGIATMARWAGADGTTASILANSIHTARIAMAGISAGISCCVL